MAYSKVTTTPGTAHSTDPKTNEPYSPYRQTADIAIRPPLVLRPPQSTRKAMSPEDVALDQIRLIEFSERRLLRLLAAPWLIMPPQGESYHLAAGITLPAIGVTATVVSIQVPSGRNGVLNKIANTFIGGGFNDFSGNIIWQILRNTNSGITAAERNYQNIQASLGMTNNPAAIAPIRVYENDIITLTVQNVSVVVASQLIGGLLGGWFYPRSMDDDELQPEKSIASW